MTPAELQAHFPGSDPEAIASVLDLLRPFDRLVPVHYQGQELLLPKRNSLWRGLQCWGMLTGRCSIDFTQFCLAGNCQNCLMRVRRPGQAPERILACQTEPEAGLEILELPEGFELKP